MSISEASNTEQSCHVAVMVAEVLEALHAERGGIFLDCTLGGAGHTQALLAAHPENRVVAIDRDESAVKRAQAVFEKQQILNRRVTVHHGRFAKVEELTGGQRFHGILADLGLSSDQLLPERGFSFQHDAPLDMRMDSTQERTAQELIEHCTEQELYVILKQGGVGKEARIVARAIIAARPIAGTKQLAQVIHRAVQNRIPAKKKDPATVIFQALRMAVNEEIKELEQLLDQIPRIIEPQGRFAAITFHSIEDKFVTRRMREWEGEQPPAHVPGSRAERSQGRVLTRKAIEPSQGEISSNRRARSARLRVFSFGLT